MPPPAPLCCCSQRRKQWPRCRGQIIASAIAGRAARFDISSWADTYCAPVLDRREPSCLSVTSAQACYWRSRDNVAFPTLNQAECRFFLRFRVQREMMEFLLRELRNRMTLSATHTFSGLSAESYRTGTVAGIDGCELVLPPAKQEQ